MSAQDKIDNERRWDIAGRYSIDSIKNYADRVGISTCQACNMLRYKCDIAACQRAQKAIA